LAKGERIRALNRSFEQNRDVVYSAVHSSHTQDRCKANQTSRTLHEEQAEYLHDMLGAGKPHRLISAILFTSLRLRRALGGVWAN